MEHLPEEVVIIILKKLDLKSIKNLYNVRIPHIQNVIRSGYMKKCDLSLSTLATIKTLKTNFFMDISINLRELDLKGVQDLTVESLLPALKRTENLNTLNVSYTNITIFDFLQIYDRCPSIKDICIDYQFKSSQKVLAPKELFECKEVFAKLDKVHFVGSEENLLGSHLPVFILQDAKLNTLTYTLSKSNKETFKYFNYKDRYKFAPVTLNNLNVFKTKWRENDRHYYGFLPPPIMRGFDDIEFILINESQFRVVYCSPAFKSFLEHSFGQRVKVFSSLPTDTSFIRACLIWNRKTTTIDETFLEQLKPKIAPLFPCKLHRNSNDEEGFSDSDEEIPITSDSLWMTYNGLMSKKTNSEREQIKNEKYDYLILDCDEFSQDKSNLELTISKKYGTDYVPLLITLSWNSHFLGKLSFLSLLYGVDFGTNFFKVLFRYAKNLKTLNIEFEQLSIRQSTDEYLLQISNNIWLSRSLKNLRIKARQLKFINITNRYLCHCKSLENIVLCDTGYAPISYIGKPEVFIKYCENLYYLRIDAHLMNSYRTTQLEFLNKVKESCRRSYLKIEFESLDYKYSYDPFIDVFKLSKIRSINL